MSVPFIAKRSYRRVIPPIRKDYGFDNHIKGQVRNPVRGSAADVEERRQKAVADLTVLAKCWNKHAALINLPIKMDVSKILRRLRSKDDADFHTYYFRDDQSGVLHETQIITVLNIISQCLKNPEKSGLLLGALQAGKTMTAIALQWLGPVNFLMTGQMVKPIYLITSQTSHEDQSRFELERFLSWYGDIELLGRSAKAPLKQYQHLDSFFENPTLRRYREVVLGGTIGDFAVDTGFLQRRVHGQQIKVIADICGQAHAHKIEPVLILDECQTGASDQEVEDINGRRHCVLRQILDAVSETISGVARYIAVSATPFELHDVSSGELPHVWRVALTLSASYVGFNYFGGSVICDGVTVRAPNVYGFSHYGEMHDIPMLKMGNLDFSMWALQHKETHIAIREQKFARWKKTHYYTKTYDSYVADFEKTIHDVIVASVTSNADQAPIGMCIRACNSNELTRTFMRSIKLDPGKIEMLEFFNHRMENGTMSRSGSVKRFLHENRKSPHLPFVIFVTNKARMGDAFPQNVRTFLDLTIKTATMNALLQGLLGRACGYNKHTTVVLSDHNAGVVRDWLHTEGGHVYPASRHSFTPGLQRKKPARVFKLDRSLDDPVVQEFFRQIDAEILPALHQNFPYLKVKDRAACATGRTGPILKIAQQLKLFEYLEKESTQQRLFPDYRLGWKIARQGQQVISLDQKGNIVNKTYQMDTRPGYEGWCRFTFRHSPGARGGMAGRGQHTHDKSRDSRTDRAMTARWLEPQINVEKYNPRTGITFDDSVDAAGEKIDKAYRKRGNWRIHMVTFPFVKEVTQTISGLATFPVPSSPFDVHMADADRALASRHLAAKAAAAERRRDRAGRRV